MRRSALLGSLMALIAALPAAAQDAPPPDLYGPPSDAGSASADLGANDTIGTRFYVAPMFSYVFADSKRDTNDGYGGVLAIGKKLTPWLALETSGFYNRFDDNTPGGNTAAQTYGGGVSALLSPIASFRDLYAIGLVDYGETKDLPKAHSHYSSVLYAGGLGYLVRLTDSGIALRAEGLYRVDTHDKSDANGFKNFKDPIFNIGLLFPLGGQPAAPAPAPAVAVVPVDDDDKDGVVNSLDQCPNTPPYAIVNAQGCELDEDGDGVVDRLDRCPGTPAGTKVDQDGCPAPQAIPAPPACRTPAAGEAISLEGCATGDTIVLQGVNFEFNQARLTVDAKLILDGVVSALLAKPDIKVEIGGHTDSKGTHPYNMKLSEHRAQSVQAYLVSKGIAADRLSAHGYGDTMPIADNNTDEGREQNRRVELKIAP